MSWTKNYTSLAQFTADYPDAGPLNQDEADQKTAARDAIWGILNSGAVGEPLVVGKPGSSGKDFYVNTSGHANPHHDPVPGGAPDFIHISVGQLRAEP